MDYKYQPPVHHSAGLSPSGAQRPRNQQNKRTAQELGVYFIGRNNRPYVRSNDNDATQAQYWSNRHEYNSSNGYYAPADSNLSHSFQPLVDTKISREVYHNDVGRMQSNGYPLFKQTEPSGNHVSNFGDLNTQHDQDMETVSEKEGSDSDGTPNGRNDASDLFVSDDDDDDTHELSEEDEETEEQFTLSNSKRSVNFVNEYSNGLGQSLWQRNKKQPAQTTPHYRQQALPMPVPSYHAQDSKPVVDPQGSMGSMSNAQQQYDHHRAQQRYQSQQRMNHHSSMSQQFSSRSVSATQGTVNDSSGDPRLVGGEGYFPPPAGGSRSTPVPRISYPTAIHGSQPTPTARSNQDPRGRMSATPSARRTSNLAAQSMPTQIKRSTHTPLASSSTRPAALNVRAPTPCRYANAPFVKAAGTGRRVPSNNVPLRQPPTTRPIPVPQPDLKPQDLGFSDAEVQKFEPNNIDKKVYQWRKEEGFGWDQIMSLLDLSGQSCGLPEVQVRQDLMNFKRSMIRSQGSVADVTDAPTVGAQEVEVDYKPLTAEDRVPKAPAAPVRSQASVSLAVIREKDKLAWQEERNDLEEAQKKAEEELTAEKLKSKRLQEELEQERLQSQGKAKLEEELVKQKEQIAKEKEQVQNLQAKLEGERELRRKAEKEWKDEKKKEHNRVLAQGATSRRAAIAQDGGFKFSNDEVSEEGVTPTRNRSRKRAKVEAQAETRGDGQAQEGGKTISRVMYTQWMNHMQKPNGNDDEMVDLDQDIPKQISEDSLTYFIYTVRRKQWMKNEDEPDFEGMVCGQYTYLNEANKASQEELFRPWGNDGIVLEQYQDYTLHGDRDRDTGLCWTTLEVPTGFVKVWVERDVHTSLQGRLPRFEPNGMLSKSVFVVRQEIDGEVEEMEEIYTTFDFANKKAADKAFELVWFEESMNIDYVNRRSEALRLKAEKLEDLEDTKQWFFEEVENNDGKAVKIWVVKRELVGPRNM